MGHCVPRLAQYRALYCVARKICTVFFYWIKLGEERHANLDFLLKQKHLHLVIQNPVDQTNKARTTLSNSNKRNTRWRSSAFSIVTHNPPNQNIFNVIKFHLANVRQTNQLKELRIDLLFKANDRHNMWNNCYQRERLDLKNSDKYFIVCKSIGNCGRIRLWLQAGYYINTKTGKKVFPDENMNSKIGNLIQCTKWPPWKKYIYM